MKVTIDRAKWRCGGRGKCRHGLGITALRNAEGYMCCLGFASLAYGATIEDITNVTIPEGVERPVLRESLLIDGELASAFAENAMDINDAEDYSLSEREALLIELAEGVGDEWEFIGEYEEGER